MILSGVHRPVQRYILYYHAGHRSRLSICDQTARPSLWCARGFATGAVGMKTIDLAVPRWLARILQEQSDGPKIYRWTIEDIALSKSVDSHHCEPPASSSGGPAPERSMHTANGISTDDARRRVYILGIGNLGRLFAASLAKLDDPPPITLVVHRPDLLEHWHAKPGLLLHSRSFLENRDERDTPITDFNIEMWSETPPPARGQRRATAENDDTDSALSGEICAISNLIIATKAQDALSTADWLRRYLGTGSTVAFAQNGMNKLWPPYGAIYNTARYGNGLLKEGRTSPLWLACIVTHGVFSLGPFESVHASPADVVLGTVGTEQVPVSNVRDGSSSYLVQKLLASPKINARWVPRPELWMLQLEKLVVNSVINPLTAILRCKNGEIFLDGETSMSGREGLPLSQIIDQLLKEMSVVLQALARLEMQDGGILKPMAGEGESFLARLHFENLQSMLYRVGNIVKDNTSSMLQDVLSGRATEVGEFNGWIVDTARYLRSMDAGTGELMDVTANQAMVDLVEQGAQLSQDELGSYFAHRIL